MDFRTVVQIPDSQIHITHDTRMVLFGSCFSESIGQKLLSSKFSVDVNPFGVLYNPFSISSALYRVLSGRLFTKDDLVFNNGIYHSRMHHGKFSSTDVEDCLQKISHRFSIVTGSLRYTDLLLVTFGTAYVYKWRNDGSIAGNCHKFPASQFERVRLTIDEIVSEWTELINRLRNVSPNLRLLFTVSPIRHWKDGAHDNQLGKSILFLAIDQLTRLFPEIAFYFPAYEILMDELRDYRYYSEDMIHPSSVAINYIWQRFGETFFDAKTVEIISEWNAIQKALCHRPLYPDTAAYASFQQDTLGKLTRFAKKYPNLSCDDELRLLTDRRDSL